MVVSPLIVAHRTFLDALLGHVQVNVNQPVLRPLCSENSQLHRVESRPGVPVGHICQKLLCLRFQHSPVHAHSLLGICHRAAQKLPDIVLFQLLQLKNPGSGNESSVHLKIGIFCGRSNQKQRPVLHKGKQIVLLALIEAVNLVHKQDGLLPVHAEGVLGLLHYLLHVLFPGHSGVNLGKPGAGRVGNHLGQSRLPRSRRPVKNDRAQLICLDGAVKQLILPDDMLLPHYLVQGGGPQPGSQRRFLLHGIASHIVK